MLTSPAVTATPEVPLPLELPRPPPRGRGSWVGGLLPLIKDSLHTGSAPPGQAPGCFLFREESRNLRQMASVLQSCLLFSLDVKSLI